MCQLALPIKKTIIIMCNIFQGFTHICCWLFRIVGWVHLLCFGQWHRRWPPGDPSRDLQRPWQCDQFERISRKAAIRNRIQDLCKNKFSLDTVCAWTARWLPTALLQPPREIFSTHFMTTLTKFFCYFPFAAMQHAAPFYFIHYLIQHAHFKPFNFHIFPPNVKNTLWSLTMTLTGKKEKERKIFDSSASTWRIVCRSQGCYYHISWSAESTQMQCCF